MLPWTKKSKKQAGDLVITTPVNGMAVPLDRVPDPAFAERMMGEGVAIEPSEGKVYAPFDGVVAQLIKSKHAVILEHESGAQLLIHIGIDTVSLKGEGFTPRVETGDRIKAGQLLLEFDIARIVEAGLPVITPLIVPEGIDAVLEVHAHEGSAAVGIDPVLTIKLA
ncbi:PTS glucose transporter subunit IIA [Paenibacillus macerans]|nr:PTS glucose transporter subunit IIA [Paenibacillus macerans]MCM3701117.1 PTS glucose transporter subunit IIA [Paenibacillus macerans]